MSQNKIPSLSRANLEQSFAEGVSRAKDILIAKRSVLETIFKETEITENMLFNLDNDEKIMIEYLTLLLNKTGKTLECQSISSSCQSSSSTESSSTSSSFPMEGLSLQLNTIGENDIASDAEQEEDEEENESMSDEEEDSLEHVAYELPASFQ